MWRVFTYNYDKDEDILYLFDKRVSPRGSLVFGDGKIIIDYGPSNALASLEILDASRYLKGVLGSQAPSPTRLTKVERAKVDIRDQDGILFLKLVLMMPGDAQAVRLNVQVPRATQIAA